MSALKQMIFNHAISNHEAHTTIKDDLAHEHTSIQSFVSKEISFTL